MAADLIEPEAWRILLELVAADCATQTRPDRAAPAGLSARGVGVSEVVGARWERSAPTTSEWDVSERYRWAQGVRQRLARRERLAALRRELAMARAEGKRIRHANRARQRQPREST